MQLLGRLTFLRPVQIHRQHVADGRARIFPFLETFHAAQHEEACAALGNKPLQQGGLLGREELRLQVIEDHRVVTVKLLGCAGKSGAQLEFIARVEPDQHRLVVALNLLGGLVAKTAKERIAGLAGAASESCL